ncbi:hypothetical protein BQ8482_80086 [Mesorhizobium delmotii]|uniref:Uncharacterized protein n=1 Tax=Mesorhizobium delmotii TaxID=1631247 RepID=A0A2P9AW68_9HYPH|nr:hypothetical protein BQ8482_80086 [Mesorhizobium delmotii]
MLSREEALGPAPRFSIACPEPAVRQVQPLRRFKAHFVDVVDEGEETDQLHLMGQVHFLHRRHRFQQFGMAVGKTQNLCVAVARRRKVRREVILTVRIPDRADDRSTRSLDCGGAMRLKFPSEWIIGGDVEPPFQSLACQSKPWNGSKRDSAVCVLNNGRCCAFSRLNRCAGANDKDRLAMAGCDRCHRQTGVRVDAADHHIDTVVCMPFPSNFGGDLRIVAVIAEKQFNTSAGNGPPHVFDSHSDGLCAGGAVNPLVRAGEVRAEADFDGGVRHFRTLFLCP